MRKREHSILCGLVEPDGVEVVVQSVAFHQLCMGAFFNQLALVQDQNSVGTLDGRQSVGDDEGGPAFHEVLERFLHQPFRFRIER